MSGEAASRADIGLPGRQRELAEALLGLGKPVIVVLCSGRPLAAPWLFERADAVLAAWFLGSEAGHAVADVLTGQVQPDRAAAGELAAPRQARRRSSTAERPTGRPTVPGVRYTSSYIDSAATPEFAFGHGLSYSRFA